MLTKLLKHIFLWPLLILLFFTASFSIAPCFKEFQQNFSGDSEIIKYPGFSKESLQSHDFQKYSETLFEKNVRLRKKFITINNQLYYTLFKKSSAAKIVIGKNDQLFEISYILDCNTIKELPSLTAWADQIAQLNHHLTSQGKTFLYIITPSKAEHLPEAIPDRFHCKNKGIKNAVYQLDKLLTERNVPHVNGPDLIKNAIDTYHMPMFPKGGIHLDWLGSAIEAAAIAEKLRLMTHIPFPQIQFIFTMGKPKEVDYDSDRDLLIMSQLRKGAITYKVPHVQFLNPTYSDKPVTLAVIGGSFTWYLNRIFLENKLFTEIHHYFYFNQYQKMLKSDQQIKWSNEVNIADILKSDIIILEENSAALVSDHGKMFYERMMG